MRVSSRHFLWRTFSLRVATRPRVLLPLLLSLLVAGCASPGRESAELRHETAERLAVTLPAHADDAAEIRARVDELLANELGREQAVIIALLDSPSLARRYAQLEVSAAERVRAARPPNPSLSFARLKRGNETETERGISIDLIGLLAWPLERSAANRQFTAQRQASLREALQLAREVRHAWTEAVAASMEADHAQRVLALVDTNREYAQRLAAAGNTPALDADRAESQHAQAENARMQAEANAVTAREKLALLLGVADSSRLQLPVHLPALPESLPSAPSYEQQAIDQRIDVQAAVRQADATAKAYKLQRVTRFVNVLDVGYQSNLSNQQATQSGFDVTLELPLFDFGSAASNEARARYEESLAAVREAATKARSETRGAWASTKAAWENAARYRDRVLPLQQKITEEVLLRFNGMLVGPAEVLEQAQVQADAALQAQQALRNFWIAEADLASVLQ